MRRLQQTCIKLQQARRKETPIVKLFREPLRCMALLLCQQPVAEELHGMRSKGFRRVGNAHVFVSASRNAFYAQTRGHYRLGPKKSFEDLHAHAAPRLYRHYTDPRTAKSLRKFPIVQIAERLYPRLMEPALIAL